MCVCLSVLKENGILSVRIKAENEPNPNVLLLVLVLVPHSSTLAHPQTIYKWGSWSVEKGNNPSQVTKLIYGNSCTKTTEPDA